MKKNYKYNDLIKKAQSVIPGGGSLFSKRPELFLPEQWPSFFSKAYEINVEDLNGKKFKDFSHFSVGTCTLGYANPEVNEAVIKCVQDGNMSTLNSYEEIEFSEALLKINSWADKVRFARSGGEANAIAIRIARNFSKKDKILFCGYHGWHDWYLSANIEDKTNLDKQLMGGLSSSGVPKSLKGTAIPFLEGDLNFVESELKKGDVAAIKMEVMRSNPVTKKYLQNIRDLANKYDSLLIFDECTSGFRETFGGLHKKYEVFPDLCMYGKAMGNGHAITAVVGRNDVMTESQNTFISSTFWTERIGYVAAKKTFEIMEREKSWEKITKIGSEYKKRISKIFEKHGLVAKITGLDALASYVFESDHLEKKTFITQEMLKKGYLVTNLFYPSICHENHLDNFFDDFELVVKDLQKKNKNLSKFLDGPVCHSTFRRLND